MNFEFLWLWVKVLSKGKKVKKLLEQIVLFYDENEKNKNVLSHPVNADKAVTRDVSENCGQQNWCPFVFNWLIC